MYSNLIPRTSTFTQSILKQGEGIIDTMAAI